MAIPTTDEFSTQVGKGPNVNLVTRALDDYWTNKGQTLDTQIAALGALIAACKAWIKKKDTKSNMKLGLFGVETNYFNTKLLDRRRHIASLGEAATKDLMMLLSNNGMIKGDVRGQLSFDIRKFREKGAHPSNRHKTKELSGGYQHERSLWLQSGKTKTVSGSIVHSFVKAKEQDTFHYERHMTGKQKKAWGNIVTKGGSSDEWKILSEVAKLGDMRVAYLKKAQRYDYMVFIRGGLLVDSNDRPLRTINPYGEFTSFLWAMDRYGNLFVYNDVAVMDNTGINMVNHSSMNSGKEVICAGMIKIDQGLVTEITNGSGHYKPTKENLAEAVRTLLGEGLDLSRADIVAIKMPGPRPGWAYYQYFDLRPFVDTNGACAPRQEVEGPQL